MENSEKPFYTPKELADKFQVHYKTLCKWIREGKIPFIKPSCKRNGCIHIPKALLSADFKARIAHFDIPKMAAAARSDWLERKPRPKKRK